MGKINLKPELLGLLNGPRTGISTPDKQTTVTQQENGGVKVLTKQLVLDSKGLQELASLLTGKQKVVFGRSGAKCRMVITE